MRAAIELANVEHVALVLEYCRLVVINVQVIWRREDCHNRREARCARFAIHAVTGKRMSKSDSEDERV
jgi:hypothetical protein